MAAPAEAAMNLRREKAAAEGPGFGVLSCIMAVCFSWNESGRVDLCELNQEYRRSGIPPSQSPESRLVRLTIHAPNPGAGSNQSSAGHSKISARIRNPK